MVDSELRKLRNVTIVVAAVCGVVLAVGVAVIVASAVLGQPFPWVVLVAIVLITFVLVRALRRYRATAHSRL